MQTETESAGTVSEETQGDETAGEATESGEPAGEQKSEKETLGTRAEVEVLGACKRRIKASVPVEKVKEELDRNYKELGSTVNLPGFRRGRVPRRLLEARFGKEIESDVKEALLSVSLSEVVEEQKLNVVGSPSVSEVQFKNDAALSYIVDLEVRPEFDLVEYKGMEVARDIVEVKEAEVDERIASLQRKGAKHVSVDPAEAGPDGVYVGKYNLYRGGEKVKSGVEVSFTPSTKVFHWFFLEDLPERVKAWDISSGEPLKLDVRARGDYPDEVLRNVDLVVEFSLEETRRVDLPELNDEFAKTLEKESLSALRADVRKSMEEWSRRESDKRVEAKILDTMLSATTMDLPEGLIQSIANRRRLEREYELLEKGVPAEEVKSTLVREWGSQPEGESAAPAVSGAPEGAAAGVASEAIRREIKEFFVLEKIASKEKIFATEEEVDKRVYLMASLYGISPARLREELRSSGRLEELRFSLRNEKVRAFLRKEARVLGPDGQPETAAS